MSRAAAPAAPEDRDLPFTVALALVALAPRLWVAIDWAHVPVWDGHYYHFGAQRILGGFGYSEDIVVDGVTKLRPWCHYPVGYSALLAGLYAIFGASARTATIFGAVCGAALAVATYRLARPALGVARARVAGAVVALHPGLIAYTAVVMTEPLAALLLVLAAWGVHGARAGGVRIPLSGLVLGAATLVRPTSLLVGPLLGWLVQARWPRRLAVGAVVTAVALVAVAPWTIRNCRVMDACALVSTNGGWNLAIGALTETGRFTTLRAADGCLDVRGQVHQDRCWADRGWRTIREDPLRWLALAPKKLGQTYDHQSFAVEYLRKAAPERWPEAKRVAGRQLMTAYHRALLVLAALGVVAWAAPRRDGWGAAIVQAALAVAVCAAGVHAFASDEHPFWPLPTLLPLVAALPLPGRPRVGPVLAWALGLLAITSATHVVFFGDDRYHLIVTPALALLAAAAGRRPGGA
ncbi:MAG: glycosyltransferase family 39 protein [Polyangiaceae bacterium]|nr:glycosyltransferase family 39 protein [Polyangiaceae bacterium]